MNEFIGRLGIDRPIIQAPMAGVQGSRLALAVCRAGGLGSLPAAMLSHDVLRKELGLLRAGTERPFNLNFFCHPPPNPDAAREAQWWARLAPYRAELGVAESQPASGTGRQPFTAEIANIVEPFAPPVVSFHFGLPPPDLLARVKRWGAIVLSSATTVDEALWLQAHGADAVIAQGLEAGGHRGHFLSPDLSLQSGSFALLPQIVAALRVPVIAAGGIADANGVRAALALGAAAVQVGTAYMLCDEADTSAMHRAALRSARDGPNADKAAMHTVLTNIFTGRPARGFANRAVRELGPIAADAPAFPRATAAMAALRAKAEAAGSGDFSPMWAGQNASGCRDVDAATLTRDLMAGV